MAISLNMCLAFGAGEYSRVERIIWIDPTGKKVVTIDTDESLKRVRPKERTITELETGIELGQIICCAEAPSTARLPLPESAISAKHRKVRDDRWGLIAPLINAPNGEIYYQTTRGPLIKQRASETGKSKKVIYDLLRRFLQRGSTKNTLLPDYHKCGTTKGKVGEHKRGRKSNLVVLAGGPPGINVDDHVLALIMKGARDFYLKPIKPTLMRAYLQTMAAYFYDHHEMMDGVLVPVLLPASQRPTYDQFCYWVTKKTDPATKLKKREGLRKFNTKHRAVLGDSTLGVFGPGIEYQIDSTIADIYLVSALDRNRIIGRPVIYFVEDTFSRLIAGLYIGLEGPSWVGAMLALENAATDKVQFCAAHGIEIASEQWPSHGLPQRLLADCGEMEGYSADNLVNGLNVEIRNTPPYRPDMKPIIERQFRLANDRSIRWLPGAVTERKERGGPDYRLDAILTLEEFRKILIRMILYHNNAYRLNSFVRHPEMIADGVGLYAVDIWTWGIVNRTGALRVVDGETIRLNLLPFAENGASVTASGILFQDLHYTCEVADVEQWYVSARERGNFGVSVVHDPRDIDTIYLVLKDRQQVIPCHLLEQDKVFGESEWYDVIDYFERLKLDSALSRSTDEQAQVQLDAHIGAIVNHAEQEAAAEAVDMSAAARIRGITENRRNEKMLERSASAWQLLSPNSDQLVEGVTNSTVGTVTEDAGEGYVGPAMKTDMLLEMLENPDNGGKSG